MKIDKAFGLFDFNAGFEIFTPIFCSLSGYPQM